MVPQLDTLFGGAAALNTISPAALSADESEIASNILTIVMQYQRVAAESPCVVRPCSRCIAVHRQRVMRFVVRGAPVAFVLPAFPAKSPNRSKVLGAAPDMAEQLSLEFLCAMCDRIRRTYRPGAQIIICSDGRVFSDLVGIDDANVTLYQAELERMIKKIGHDSLKLFNLDHEYAGYPHAAMRRNLTEGYGEDLDVLKQQVRAGSKQLTLYRGITKFLLEDADTPDYQGSRAALQRQCRKRAYGVMQRSKAWARLIAQRYPDAVRLSIHPQHCGSTKIGIHLVATLDNWLTPWHGVAVDLGARFLLMKRYQAEATGAQLIHINGKPSHYATRRADPLCGLPEFATVAQSRLL